MFSLSSLVGGGKGPTQLEFTPIGRRGNQTKSKTAPETTPLVRNENALPESPYESSPGRFDSTFSLDQDPIPRFSIAGSRDKQDNERLDLQGVHDKNRRNLEPRTGLIGDGSTSIQSLQNEVQQLLSENYNLRVEVATLKQYLRQSPLETRDLALENSNLKQDIMELTRQVETAREAIEAGREGIGRSNSVDRKLDLERKELEIERKDREIEKLQLAYTELQLELQQQRATTSIPDEVVERIEYLEGENQALHRQIQDATSANKEISNNYEREADLNDLKAELHRAKMKLALLPPDAEEQLRSLMTENDVLARKLHVAQTDAQQLQNERDSFEDQLKALQVDLDARAEEVRRWRREAESTASNDKSLGEVQRELLASKREVEDLLAKLSVSKREAQDLKTRHNGVERENRLIVENLEAKISSLQSKLLAINETLKDKDKDNYELRAEVRSLMDERSTHFDNQSTVRRYQQQIDALRHKEQEMGAELADLRTALASERSKELLATERDTRIVAELEELQTKLDYYEEQYALLEDSKRLADEEVEHLESKLRATEDLLKHAEEDKRRVQDESLELEKEVEVLRARVRRSEISGAHKYNELALLELDDLHKKREDAERARLHAQISDLRAQVNTLEQDLERSRTNRASSLELSDSKSAVSRELHRLRNELEDKELELHEHRSRAARLLSSLKDKDLALDALEIRVRELNRELKATVNSADTRWTDVQRLQVEHARELQNIRFEHEKALRNLLLENERLERTLKDESQFYKAQADAFQKRDTDLRGSNITFGFSDNFSDNQKDAHSAMVALLEIQVEQARRESKQLREELRQVQRTAGGDVQTIDTYKAEIRDLQRRLDNLQSQVDSLKLECDTARAQSAELRSKQIKTELEKDALETKLEKTKTQLLQRESTADESKVLQNENMALESENKSLHSEVKALLAEVKSLQSEFKSLQNDYRSLQSDYKASQNDNKSLQIQVSDLMRNESLQRRLDRAESKALDTLRTENNLLKSDRNKLDLKARNLAAELERTSLACTSLAAKMKAMEVEQYRQTQKQSQSQSQAQKQMLDIDALGTRLSTTKLAETETRLWKNKVYYTKLVAAETAARCDDLRTINAYANKELQRVNGGHIAGAQKQSSGKGKPSFKRLALMVLAAVRMKNLGEKGRKHKLVMEQIHRDIVRDRDAWLLYEAS